MTIDMKDYAGEYSTPAAVEQDTSNSYSSNELDFPVLPPEQESKPEHEEPSALKVDAEPIVQEDFQERNFKALSESVERLKAEKNDQQREFQLQLDMIRANLVRGQQPEQSKEKRMLDGMDDNDVPNVGEIRKAWAEKESTYNERIEELQVANAHSDYAEVLQKYGKHLAETDPFFLQGLRGAENKAMFAYQYAKREQELQQYREASKTNSQPTPSTPSENAQRIVDNARKPGTLAQAGGQSVLSKADYFSTMSDAEFMQMASKHLETI